MKKNDLAKLIVAILVPQAAGALGSLFTAPSISTWYSTLIKPSFNPPSWIFAPVWTALFLLMGIAAFLVWKRGWEKREVRIALGIFGGQLILNILWSALFFGLHSPLAAFVEVIILWLAILGTILVFRKISKTAAWLLVPYILWVSFASLLNFSLMILNR